MHKAREKLVEHGAVLAGRGAGHHAAAAGGRLGRIGSGLGIDQRQFCHPIGRLAHDLEGDIAAHRMPGEREARRRLGRIRRAIKAIWSSRMWLATVTGPNRQRAGSNGA